MAVRSSGRPRVPSQAVREDPEALIADRTLPPLARVVYCVLVGLSQLNRHDILSSFAAIAAGYLSCSAAPVRQAVLALERAGWLGIKQKSKYAPIRFSFPNPQGASRKADAAPPSSFSKPTHTRRRGFGQLWYGAFSGLGHYKEQLYPKFLINPDTNELLQADRYYLKHNAIIEFQGPQHDGATELFSEEEAREQMERDRIKRQICARHKIPPHRASSGGLDPRTCGAAVAGFSRCVTGARRSPSSGSSEKRSRRYREIWKEFASGRGRADARRPATAHGRRCKTSNGQNR